MRRTAAALLVAVLVLAGCASDGSSEGAPAADDEATTTTAASDDGAGAEDDSGALDAMTEEFLTDLRAGLVDVMSEEQADCVVDALDVGVDEPLDEGALQASYDECGVRVSQIVAVQLYDSYVEAGVSEEAAACLRDAVAALEDEEMDAFTDEQGQALAEGCGVDQALLGG